MSEPSLEEVYREEYEIKGDQRGIKQYAAKQDMAAALDRVVRPDSVLDVGCGRGWWMEYWLYNRPKARVWGVDGVAGLIARTGSCLPLVAHHMSDCDLRGDSWWRPHYDAADKWDLVLCVEVAEHLPEECAPGLVERLCQLGRTVFFSAARPGQKGVHHVNCQPKPYWIELFEARGFEPREDLLREWRERLSAGHVCKNIRRNALFFTPRRVT